MRNLRTPAFLLLPLLLGGCAVANDDEGVQVAIAHLSEADDEVGGALLVRDELGRNRALDRKTMEITAQAQDAKGNWFKVEVRQSKAEPRIHTVIVADNSGSQGKTFMQTQEANRVFAKQLLDQGTEDPDRVGIVRVSTEARVLTELTNNPKEFNSAVDAMFVSNGWTALYDGVRVANEVLDRGAFTLSSQNKEWSCVDRAFNSVVVFTDGRDNNSSDMQKTSYKGDGIDTTLESLAKLEILGVRTPVYAVGIGRSVDESSLSELSKRTGGFYSPIDSYEKLAGALEQQASSMRSATPFCFRLPYCDIKAVRVHVRFQLDGSTYDRTLDVRIPEGTCDGSVSMEAVLAAAAAE